MSDAILELEAQTRSDIGKGASRRLRRKQNLIPAVIYGGDKPAQSLTLSRNEITKATQNEVFFASILTLKIDGKSEKVVLKDMQRHPAKSTILHADFLRINESEEMTMHIQLHFIGEETSPGIKAGGVVNHAMTEVEIKCLPANLPEAINVDVTNLNIGDALHISNIILPKGVKFVHEVEDDAHDHLVYSISEPRMAEEIDTAAPEAQETEVLADRGDAADDKAAK